MRLIVGLGVAVGAGSVLAGCSLLLDWNGYTGRSTDAGAVPEDSGAVGQDGATIGVADATMDTRAEASPAGGDASDGSVVDAGRPPCSSSCGGCCDDGGTCVGGQSATTCGKGGAQCQDCTASGQTCSDSVCTSAPPPADGGGGGTCVKAVCPPLCAPVYQAVCCKADNTCGCQVQIPPSPDCR